MQLVIVTVCWVCSLQTSTNIVWSRGCLTEIAKGMLVLSINSISQCTLPRYSSQKSIDVSVSGPELPQAVLEYIRHNDMAVLEGCDKVGMHACL